MKISPEERQRIYEEEKARIEGERSSGLKPNTAAFLCYLGVWVTGIIFLIIERKDRLVRFHAMQSLVTFGILSIIIAIADSVRHWLPYWNIPPLNWIFYPQIVAANVIFGISWAVGIVLWIVMMYQTYHGRLVKLAVFGNLAEKILIRLDGAVIEEVGVTPEGKAEESKTSGRETGIGAKKGRFLEGTRGARITASAAAIGWSAFFLVLFNFFSDYIAIYSREAASGVTTWHIYPLLTPALGQVLPILNATLIATIAGHIVAIAIDRYRLRAIILITLNCLGMATVLTFLRIFPFDFSVIPVSGIASVMPTAAVVIMIIITVALGITALVRFIRLMIDIKKKSHKEPS